MDYQEDKLTETIIQCVIEVHKKLGPGFLESVYRRALVIGHSLPTRAQNP